MSAPGRLAQPPESLDVIEIQKSASSTQDVCNRFIQLQITEWCFSDIFSCPYWCAQGVKECESCSQPPVDQEKVCNHACVGGIRCTTACVCLCTIPIRCPLALVYDFFCILPCVVLDVPDKYILVPNRNIIVQ